MFQSAPKCATGLLPGPKTPAIPDGQLFPNDPHCSVMDHPHLFQSATPVPAGERFGLKKGGEEILSPFFLVAAKGPQTAPQSHRQRTAPGIAAKKTLFWH